MNNPEDKPSTSANTKPKDSKKKPSIFAGHRNFGFMILLGFFVSIFVPYVYYSIKVYQFNHRNDGKTAPTSHMTDIWVSLVSALAIRGLK